MLVGSLVLLQGCLINVTGRSNVIYIGKLYYQKLDYCSTVWDPHCVGHIKVLEKVQKRAARVVLGKWDIDYKLVLNELKWLSLHKRHTYLRNLTCYKIINNLIDLPFENCFMLRQGRHLRYCHSHTLEVKFARTDVCKFSFFFRTVHDWNKLPVNLVLNQNFENFKSKLFTHKFQDNSCQSCAICDSI